MVNPQFKEVDNFYKIIKDIIKEELKKQKIGISVWQVTDIKSKQSNGYITDYKCNIKKLNFKLTLDDVPIVGLGLGNNKGVIKYPNVGDFVIVAFDESQPIILGTVYDYFSQRPDLVPNIKLNELAIVQKEKGSIILMKENNDVMIRIADETGNFNNGAKLRLNHDGSFKILSKTNNGIWVDKDGNMKISAVDGEMINTPISWD